MRHLSDRFIAAVRLCTSSLPVKQRLTEAWQTQLDDLRMDQIPVQLRGEFGVLRSAMYEYKPQPDEAAPVASVRKMSARQATRYTALIVKMLGEILRLKYARANLESGIEHGAIQEADSGLNHESDQQLN
jgi:hypothetical protein